MLQSFTPYYKVLRQHYKVLLRTTSVLLRTTKYYASTTLNYKVLLQFYKVLRQYYKVLRQYYSSTQTTTPVLLRTSKYYSKYYSSTTKYYSVVEGITPVLQSTTPVLLRTTKYYSKYCACHEKWHLNSPVKQNDSHAWSSSHMKRHLQCVQQQVSRSNLTKYCACHAERLACFIVVTYETSFTRRAATGVTIQPHQILRLPRRKTCVLNRRHIWNVIYNGRSNRCHDPTLPNTAPATQKDSHASSLSDMKRHLIGGATGVTIQPHQILRLPQKITLQHFRENFRKRIKRHLQCGADPTMIREWSDHETVRPQPASQPRLLVRLAGSIFFWKIQRFAPNLTFQHSPSTAPATKCDTWTSPSSAPATKSDTWASPSAAPATKSDTWTSPSTAPATKSNTWISPSTAPATKSDTWASPSAAPATKSDTWTSPSTAPATKSNTWISPSTAPATKSDTSPSPSTAPAMKSNTWTSPSIAPATKSDTWTSPNAAPATKSDSYAWSSSHMKPHLQCAEQQVSPSNLTKYCACHKK